MEQVVKTYQDGARTITAVNQIDLQVDRGEIFGIIGHSGAGKSSLLRCVNLLEVPTSGKVIVDEVELTQLSSRRLQERRRKIGMIFQHFNLLSSAKVADNIAFPLRLAKHSKASIEARVRELLELVGLQEHAHKYPSQLSGGQKQRVGIARALANQPDVLLCDEATSALDPQTTNSILSLLLDINRRFGITILLITHEMHVIRSICDRVAVMDNGQIVETGNVLDVFLKPSHPVTREFIGQLQSPDDAAAPEASSPAEAAPHQGTVIRVTFVGKQTYEPVLFETVKATNVSFAILQGTISSMKHTPYGQLVVELIGGEEAERGLVVSRLREKGMDVEVMSR
jgi:D-methionine transport system ATP-binding protein